MEKQDTKLPGCFILKPTIFRDQRGYFFESFNQQLFEKLILANGHFVQDNQAYSKYGTVRGLHFQKGASAQAKLVRVLQGKVWDVAVDIRPDSPTYLQWVGAELSDENNHQLYIPRGFAHGYSVLSDSAVFAYKCDNYYDKVAEGGIRYNDPKLQIDWKIPESDMLLSDKDQLLSFLEK